MHVLSRYILLTQLCHIDNPFSADRDFLFFFNDTATTEIYTLSLHDALPICVALQLPADDSAAPGYRIVAAMDIGFHLDFLAEFKRMLWWATCLVLCIALGVAWLAVQWGHLPIDRKSVV